MKCTKILGILVVVLGLIFCQARVCEAWPMGSAFTYQGRLIDANKPADGLYDFQFNLFNDPCTGSQQGSTIDINDLDVIDGYFTVELDFGSTVFTGDARWLETAVRPGDSNDPNVYTTLMPRQELTPVPYALKTRGLFVDNNGNVGIGTRYPNFKLTLNDDGGIYAKGSFGSGASLGFTGVGSRLIWYPRKAAFRAGYVDGYQWSNTYTGDYSIAMGYNTSASGDYSTATGYGTTASGRMSTAMGKESHAWGNQSTAIGTDTYARGLSSIAMGTGATSEGHFSASIGTDTSASGYASTAIGWGTTSSGDDSTAIGKYLTAGANNSIVLGSGVNNSIRLINNTENSLIVGFGSAPTLFVDGSNVGIGTTSPSSKLSISGDIDISGSRLHVGTNGNVGIGTSSPGAKLDVEGYIQTHDNLPFSIRRYTGTLGTIGSRTFAHGIGNGHHKGLVVQAWCKGNTNEMMPMDVEYMDGGQIRIINGIAYRPYRVTIIYTSSDHVW